MLQSLVTRFRRLRTRIRSRREGRTGTTYTVAHDTGGLQLTWRTLENDEGQSSFTWDQVQNVLVYKRDLHVVDLVCVVFVLAGAEAVEVHEEMAGWQRLVESLPKLLPGALPFAEWWPSVAVPAFAPSTRVIYTRSGGGAL